jgi:hypothetical protein
VALAAQKQGKYWELHKAMLSAKGQMNEASALQIAEKLGLDMDKLKKDMVSPEVKAEIEKSAALAKKLGVTGTPHFLIGDRAVKKIDRGKCPNAGSRTAQPVTVEPGIQSALVGPLGLLRLPLCLRPVRHARPRPELGPELGRDIPREQPEPPRAA